MSVKNVYKTVGKESRSFLVEKKSKFITSVKPVDNERDALDFINAIRSEYPDATHNVYAYVIDENNIFRYSDDGEPSGTAGMPVLDAIRKSGIVDAAVVVTRYFGGTLLGTGGLVHTYGAAAKRGLEESKIITRCLCDIMNVKTDYSLLGKMQYEIASRGYILLDTIYEDSVTFVIACPSGETENIKKGITDMTSGRAECAVTGNRYIDMEEEQS